MFYFCSKEEENICRFAQALKPGANRDTMDQYLLGQINPYNVARMIHHNNVFHNGDTADQMIQFCQIIEEKKQWGLQYEKLNMIAAIRNNLVEIQRVSGYVPRSAQSRRQTQNAMNQIQNAFTGQGYPTIQVFNSLYQQHQFNRVEYTFHHPNIHQAPLNLNEFIMNPFNPSEGDIPTFSLIHPNFIQPNEENDVIITKVVPASPTMSMKNRRLQ